MQITRSSFSQSLPEFSRGELLNKICVIAMWVTLVVFFTSSATASPRTPSSTHAVVKLVGVGDSTMSVQARQIANWVAESLDNRELDFVIIDKKNATVHVFNANAQWLGSSPVLLGSALGDESVPGIGSRPINNIAAAERTTPAGRFIAERGKNISGEDIVWIDYDAAVSMHRVRVTNKAERRLERLATPSPADNRISYGCINVPVRFYETYLQSMFAKSEAVVYVLPEVKSLAEVFGVAASVTRLSGPKIPALP